MKKIIVYASAAFHDESMVREALKQFVKENKIEGEEVCLYTPRRQRRLVGICSKMAMEVTEVFHTSNVAAHAESLRDKLCKGAHGALIFWDGRSVGTQKLIDKVERLDIPFAVHVL